MDCASSRNVCVSDSARNTRTVDIWWALTFIVYVLISPIEFQIFGTQITFDGIFTPFGRGPTGSPVLVRDHLSIPPEPDETVGQDPSGSTTIAVIIRHAFPRDDGRESLGSPGGHSPLTTGIVTDPQQTYSTRTPRLFGRPFHNVEKCLARTSRHCIHDSRGLTQAHLVGSDYGVTVSTPKDRFGSFPSCVS